MVVYTGVTLGLWFLRCVIPAWDEYQHIKAELRACQQSSGY